MWCSRRSKCSWPIWRSSSLRRHLRFYCLLMLQRQLCLHRRRAPTRRLCMMSRARFAIAKATGHWIVTINIVIDSLRWTSYGLVKLPMLSGTPISGPLITWRLTSNTRPNSGPMKVWIASIRPMAHPWWLPILGILWLAGILRNWCLLYLRPPRIYYLWRNYVRIITLWLHSMIRRSRYSIEKLGMCCWRGWRSKDFTICPWIMVLGWSKFLVRKEPQWRFGITTSDISTRKLFLF